MRNSESFISFLSFFGEDAIHHQPRLGLPDEIGIIAHCSRRLSAEIIVHTPLHQSVIFQCQVAMGKATRNQHLLLIFKGEDLAVSISKSIARSEVNCHIENRTMQAGYTPIIFSLMLLRLLHSISKFKVTISAAEHPLTSAFTDCRTDTISSDIPFNTQRLHLLPPFLCPGWHKPGCNIFVPTHTDADRKTPCHTPGRSSTARFSSAPASDGCCSIWTGIVASKIFLVALYGSERLPFSTEDRTKKPCP